MDTKTYQIQLDDYHPGEITGFDSSAACRDRDIWANGHWEGHCGDDFATDSAEVPSPNCRVLPGMNVDMLSVNDEGYIVDEDDASMTRWVLTGVPSQLRQAYQELLAALSGPAWHWYAMGGDDYCYDYWPNTMRLAVEFRDQLIDVANKEADEARARYAEAHGLGAPNSVPADIPWNYVYNTQYLADDLCHIYWLARTRYARVNDAAGRDLSGGYYDSSDEYFERDILSHGDFGDCPAWLAR